MKNKRNPVGWFEIYVQDMKRAKKFYEKTLAVKLQALPSPIIKMMAFPMGQKLPGCPGALVKMKGKDSGDGGILIYFSCKDCAIESTRAVKNGGEVFKEKAVRQRRPVTNPFCLVWLIRNAIYQHREI